MKKKTTAQPQAPLAYVGPTIPGVAVSGEVYTNGLPAALAAAAEKKPLLNTIKRKLKKQHKLKT